MAVSATMTPNIFKYIQKTLNFKTPIHLYQKLLDCPNITYIVTPITSFGFEDRNFLILPKISGIGNIEKTMILLIVLRNVEPWQYIYKLFCQTS